MQQREKRVIGGAKKKGFPPERRSLSVTEILLVTRKMFSVENATDSVETKWFQSSLNEEVFSAN